MSTTAVAQGSRTAAAERWLPSPLIRTVFVLHALIVATLIAEPELWIEAFAALGLAHATMAFLGLMPRSRWLGDNLTHLPAAAAARGEVALTFDDGPDPSVTPKILDLLDAHHAKASFFCIGTRVEAHPALAREILRRGHSLENHTYSHPLGFACLMLDGLAREIGAAKEAIAAATGSAPRFFRAPMGLRNPLLDLAVHRAGQRYVSWTRRGFDTVGRNPDAVLRRLTGGLRAGDVLVLHDGNSALTRSGEPVVLAVLPRLLESLHARGLRAVSLPMGCESAPRTNEPQGPAQRPEHQARVHADQQNVVA